MSVAAPSDRSKVTPLTARLQLAEAETLVLAEEQDASAVLVDDLEARNFAKAMGLRVIGTAGTLLLAREKGITVDVAASLDTMRARGFRLSDRIY